MNRRVFSAMVGLGFAVPSVVLQLALQLHDRVASLGVLPWLFVANLALLFALAAVAADYPIAGRAGRAALIGLGVALLMPGPTAVDAMVMNSDVVVLVPFLLLLAMLACAEAGLYLLATRTSGAAERS